MGDLTSGLLNAPPIEMLGPLVPGANATLWIADQNGIVGHVGELVLLVQTLQKAATLGDIPIDFQDGGGHSLVIAGQHLTAFDDHLSAIPAGVGEFSFPLTMLLQSVLDRFR